MTALPSCNFLAPLFLSLFFFSYLALWVTVGCRDLVPITDCSVLTWHWDSRLWVSGPHSSQFTHQTLQSTIWPLRKVTLPFNNSLTNFFLSLGSEAIFCSVSKAWMEMNNGIIQIQSYERKYDFELNWNS